MEIEQIMAEMKAYDISDNTNCGHTIYSSTNKELKQHDDI